MTDIGYHFAGEENIPSPQLVYYPEIIKGNIRKMIDIAGGSQRLWPHIKTHKIAEVVKLQLEAGIDRFKCATIAEAEMAARAGARQLALAYPLVGPNIGRFLKLRALFPNVTFYAIGDDTEQIALLGQAAAACGQSVKVLLDVDMGQHRTGVQPDCIMDTYRIWSSLPGIALCGLHCYDGHRHEPERAVRDAEVLKIDTLLESIKANLVSDGYDFSIMIMGGTPSFPCHAAFTKEYLSPGTCVVQDAGYRAAYRDLDFVPGAAVLTRVISHPGHDKFTLDMGVKAVAGDPTGERAELVGMEYVRTELHNEEHWVVQVPTDHIQDIPPIGTVMYAIPAHICPTSALYPAVPAVENGQMTGWWQVAARNRMITV